jgi:DNA repair photolyase
LRIVSRRATLRVSSLAYASFTMSIRPPTPPRGRGARSNPDNRFAAHSHELVDDGWGGPDEAPPPLRTILTKDSCRTIINYNRSPDVGFDRSVNPYRGCEHGCVYCFARPSHAYLGLSPGLDFESRLFYKPNAAMLLRQELSAPAYRCAPIAVGINTDAYQPVERKLGITREVLEVLRECDHPFTLVTKSWLVERDIDLLAEMAQKHLVQVMVSITTLRHDLARTMEPRAAAPSRRLKTIERLNQAGIPVGVLVAPLIPVLTDSEMETILSRARAAGAGGAGYVLLRLPHEVKDLFREWLTAHEPTKAEHVMQRLRDSRGGRDYDAEFGTRMRGTGVFADLIAKRFRIAYERLAYGEDATLETGLFHAPRQQSRFQLELF